jgi:signal transduction histidine kinase
VVVHLHLDDQLPPLWGGPHQLQQVVVNLLTNAQQALRAVPGPREITLTTQYDLTQHQITLAVTDTGPGIPPALQTRIFEPFFTSKPLGAGMGLGLPLCRGIVETHGGTLVSNGRLALAKVDERTYDLILSDIRMPELDGPSFYRLLG